MQADGFDQVIKGLENLVKFGFDRNFTINTVIMKQNIPYLEEVMELILEKKAPQAQYRFIDGKNVFDNYKDFVPKYKKAASVVRKMVDKYHNEIKMSVREFPICVLGEEYKKFLSPEINNRLNLTLDNKLFNEERIEKEQFCYPNCKNCIYKSRCYGVRKEYYKVYGAKELSPITS